ncbi:MAG: hypothetical protein NVSMB54_15670 [Ktedonobacteraceae bacterium]
MAIEQYERQGRLVPLLNLISGVLEQHTSSALTQEDADALIQSDDDLLALAVMQRLAFRAIVEQQEKQSLDVTQTPCLNADFS